MMIKKRALVCILLVLIGVLAGCVIACTSSTTQEELPTTAQTQAVTTKPKDPWDAAIVFTDNKEADFKIIVSSDATSWENKAATDLADVFAGVGVTVPIKEDDQVSSGEWEIVIGRTNRQNQVQADFFNVGENGYHIRMVGSKLFVGANSQTGMERAMEKLFADLLQNSTQIGLYDAYVCRVND